MVPESNDEPDEEMSQEAINNRFPRRSVLRGLSASAGLTAVSLIGVNSVTASTDGESRHSNLRAVSESATDKQCEDGDCITVVKSSEEVNIAEYTYKETTHRYRIDKTSGEVWHQEAPAETNDGRTDNSLNIQSAESEEEKIIERSEGHYDSHIGGCGSVYSDHEAVGVSLETGDDIASYSAGALGGVICHFIPYGGTLFAGACGAAAAAVTDALDLSSSSELTFWAWDNDQGYFDVPEVEYSGTAYYGGSLNAAQRNGVADSIAGAHISGL